MATALSATWEGDSSASADALVSPETGLMTAFANIAVGDRCIAAGLRPFSAGH
jgi:hypothetical protein